MPDTQTLGLIIAATVAAVLLFRLYTVLGRRTGHEPAPPESRPALAPIDRPTLPANGPDPLARGLMEVQLADRTFDKVHFLKGARSAYEMIQNAFTAGDRTALRPLLSEDVFAAFDGVIAGRTGAATEKLGGITDARIAGAILDGNTAEVTVAFRAQFVGADDKDQRDVSDVWTFARRVGASDPNWTLIATSGDAA